MRKYLLPLPEKICMSYGLVVAERRISLVLPVLMVALFLCAGSAFATVCPVLPQLNWLPASDWINVKDHGVYGDDSHDDTAAVQAIFNTYIVANSSSAHSRPIWFPPGTYRISSTLTTPAISQWGGMILGNGRDTRLVWYGSSGGTMIQVNGLGSGKWQGLDLDGRNIAATGMHHWNSNGTIFSTHERFRHLAFHNFTSYGFYKQRPAQSSNCVSEPFFENCIFDHCGTGVWGGDWNDLCWTFTGCEFRSCGTGLYHEIGSFGVRDCHFEANTVEDIYCFAGPGKSVRRCTSLNSNRFLNCNDGGGYTQIVVEGCTISGWTDTQGAIKFPWYIAAIGPTMVFDCTFRSPPTGAQQAIYDQCAESMVLSQNSVPAGCNLYNTNATHVYTIPAGAYSGGTLPETQQFMTPDGETIIPAQIYDAKAYGAYGDCIHNDTVAVQNCITAAVNSTSSVAMVYLPAGYYIITSTLTMNNTSSGRKIIFGGAGAMSSRLLWCGAAGGTTLSITNPQNVLLQDFRISDNPAGTGIYVTGTSGQPSITFDGIFVQMLRINNMCSGSFVHLRHIDAQQYFTDCADAVILGSWIYNNCISGSLIGSCGLQVDLTQPSSRNGFMGFMWYEPGNSPNPAVWIKNNLNLVISDGYFEEVDHIFKLDGGQNDPPGRFTFQGEKLHVGNAGVNSLETNGYQGQIVLGPTKFASDAAGVNSGIMSLSCNYGNQDVILVAATVRSTLTPTISGNVNLYKMGLSSCGGYGGGDLSDNYTSTQLTEIATALDDLRTLGAYDLSINYGIIPMDAWWKFDETSGSTVSDSTGNGNIGTLRNSPTWTTGYNGGALLFNGLNSLVSVPCVESLKYKGGNLTLDLWINIDPTETDGAWLVSKPWSGSGSHYNYYLTLNTAMKISFGLQMSDPGATTITTTNALSTNAWHHVVATADKDKHMTIYVDGTVAASGVHSITNWAPGGIGDANIDMAIGTIYPYSQGWSGSSSFTFKGKIDDLTVTLTPPIN